MAISGEKRNLHMAEFGKLSAEIAELVKSTSQLFNSAVLGSGALFAWLLTKTDVPLPLRTIGLVAPALLTSVLAMMAFAQAIRISQMGDYLAVLEKELGAPNLGWEEFFKRKSAVIGITTKLAWVVLLAGDIIGAIAAIKLG